MSALMPCAASRSAVDGPIAQMDTAPNARMSRGPRLSADMNRLTAVADSNSTHW